MVALGPSGGVLIDHDENGRHEIDQYGPTGARLARFDARAGSGVHGIAYSRHTGMVYVIDTNSNVSPPIARVRIVRYPMPGSFGSVGNAFAEWALPFLSMRW